MHISNFTEHTIEGRFPFARICDVVPNKLKRKNRRGGRAEIGLNSQVSVEWSISSSHIQARVSRDVSGDRSLGVLALVHFDLWERGLIGDTQICVTNNSGSKLPDSLEHTKDSLEQSSQVQLWFNSVVGHVI